jgi:DNA mismatch repair ATPase MutS
MGFATLARELALTRPEMVQGEGEEGVFEVRGGRHIGVELGLLERSPARSFHSNDLIMSSGSAVDAHHVEGEGKGRDDDAGGRLHFITGPNMGGKSTYLRQNALIAILAQTGSFVPAAHVRMSVVDRLFSRVGAKDDLFRDRSTFMVSNTKHSN